MDTSFKASPKRNITSRSTESKLLFPSIRTETFCPINLLLAFFKICQKSDIGQQSNESMEAIAASKPLVMHGFHQMDKASLCHTL